MTSATAICNRALQKVGEKRVSAVFPPEDSKQARACNVAYDPVRKMALRSYEWNFAKERASLAADGTDPIWEHDKRYLLPADCLKVSRVNTTYGWQIEGRYIVTDATAPLQILYIKDITDPTVFDAAFAEYLAHLLAIELVETLIQSGTTQDRLRDKLNRELMDMVIPPDATEGTPEEADQDDWITVRF